MNRAKATVEDIPVLILHATTFFRELTYAEIAAALDLNRSIDEREVQDVAIVGTAPTGLSAAVDAASEAFAHWSWRSKAPGRHAGSSSKIENYLGFITGITGLELAARAYTQYQKFGAEMLIAVPPWNSRALGDPMS